MFPLPLAAKQGSTWSNFQMQQYERFCFYKTWILFFKLKTLQPLKTREAQGCFDLIFTSALYILFSYLFNRSYISFPPNCYVCVCKYFFPFYDNLFKKLQTADELTVYCILSRKPELLDYKALSYIIKQQNCLNRILFSSLD